MGEQGDSEQSDAVAWIRHVANLGQDRKRDNRERGDCVTCMTSVKAAEFYLQVSLSAVASLFIVSVFRCLCVAWPFRVLVFAILGVMDGGSSGEAGEYSCVRVEMFDAMKNCGLFENLSKNANGKQKCRQ